MFKDLFSKKNSLAKFIKRENYNSDNYIIVKNGNVLVASGPIYKLHLPDDANTYLVDEELTETYYEPLSGVTHILLYVNKK